MVCIQIDVKIDVQKLCKTEPLAFAVALFTACKIKNNLLIYYFCINAKIRCASAISSKLELLSAFIIVA